MSITKYTPITIHASDSSPETANIPTAQQLNKQPQANGSLDFYAQVPRNSQKEITWRIKLATMLVDKLEPDRRGDGKTYILMGFPKAYMLYEHVRQPAEGTPQTATTKRQDVYLYGYPNSRKRYRSPAEFFPHLLWLATTGGTDRRCCGCTMCGGNPAAAPTPSSSGVSATITPIMSTNSAPEGTSYVKGTPSNSGTPGESISAQSYAPDTNGQIQTRSAVPNQIQNQSQMGPIDMSASASAPQNNLQQQQQQPQYAQQQQYQQQYPQYQQPIQVPEHQHQHQNPSQRQQQQQEPLPSQQQQQQVKPSHHQYQQPVPPLAAHPPPPQTHHQVQYPPQQQQQQYESMASQSRSPMVNTSHHQQLHLQQQPPQEQQHPQQQRQRQQGIGAHEQNSGLQHQTQPEPSHSPVLHRPQPHYTTTDAPIEMPWSMDDMESVIQVNLPTDGYDMSAEAYGGEISMEDDDEAFLRSLVPNPNNKMP